MSKYEVNIDLANATKKEMSKRIDTQNNRVLNKFGAFSSLYDIKFDEYPNPVLVLKTEEPGSKQMLAIKYDRIEGICYDMINHLINDCIVMGATPLTVQDAIICGKLDKNIATRIVSAIAQACNEQGCVLTGGETSEQPGVLSNNVYVLTSSIVGIVDKSSIIDGSAISVGDSIIALESSGIHTNGYTLVRKIMDECTEIKNERIDGREFIDVILEPHRCYYQSTKESVRKQLISGMAHITGGGIKENLNRILPNNVDAEIDLSSYRIPSIFSLLKKYGNISADEMLRTFNLGVGMTLVVPTNNIKEVIDNALCKGVNAYVIGQIVSGKGQVKCINRLNWCY